jgi:hypothetical protein
MTTPRGNHSQEGRAGLPESAAPAVAATPPIIVFQMGRPYLARPDAARHYEGPMAFSAGPGSVSCRTGGPGSALWPVFRAGPARRRRWPDGPRPDPALYPAPPPPPGHPWRRRRVADPHEESAAAGTSSQIRGWGSPPALDLSSRGVPAELGRIERREGGIGRRAGGGGRRDLWSKATARGGRGWGPAGWRLGRLATRFGEPSSRRGWEKKRKGRSGLGCRRGNKGREESGRGRGRLEAARVRGVWWAVLRL